MKSRVRASPHPETFISSTYDLRLVHGQHETCTNSAPTNLGLERLANECQSRRVAGSTYLVHELQQSIVNRHLDRLHGTVADVLAALEHDAQLTTAQQQALDIAANNLSLTRESYSAGNVGVLQIIEAERSVQRARIGVARAQAQRLQDTAELIVALGGDSPIATAAAAR